LFETLEGITTSLVVVTITTYSTVLSTHELVATMQATWASLHYAVGRALGSGVGGYLIDNLGSKYAYQLYAVVCLLAATLYLGLYLVWLKKLETGRRKKAQGEEKPIGHDLKDIHSKDTSNGTLTIKAVENGLIMGQSQGQGLGHGHGTGIVMGSEVSQRTCDKRSGTQNPAFEGKE
jgi:MFS family permease